MALFQAISLAGALLVGGAGGSALGALAGHVAGGMSRSDLKELPNCSTPVSARAPPKSSAGAH
jgi:hypothetical protein